MSHEFINPNWHVILIHYPIGLLTLGLLIEIVSVFNRTSGLRAAGRWMIAIGGVLTIPTLTAGLYAFRDVVSPNGFMMDQHWREVVADSDWNAEQWRFISRHILYNAVATGLVVLVVFLWLANSDRVRRKIYWLLLLALVVACGLLGAGAWHGGEAVYRLGTGVQAVRPNPPAAQPVEHNLDYYAPPLQLHVIFAGLAVAAIVVSIALMFRRWEKPAIETGDAEKRPLDPLADDPAGDRRRAATVRTSEGEYTDETTIVREPPRVFPGRFFFAAFVLAVITAFFGAWSSMGELSGQAFRSMLDEVKEPDNHRLLVHVIAGVCIIVLAALVGMLVGFLRRQRAVPLLLVLALLIAVGLQLWFGIALLYDSHEGPIFRFAAVEATEHSTMHPPAAATPSTTNPLHMHSSTTKPAK